LFVPDTAGTIIPHGGSVGGTVQHINFAPVTHIDARSDQAQILQLVNGVNAAFEAKLARRAKFGG
jgi:hypothetical protein